MRRRLLSEVKSNKEADVCDVVFANNQTGELIITKEWRGGKTIFPIINIFLSV